MNAHPSVFAKAAYEIEREGCKKPVGKQDAYISSFGGLHYFQFHSDDTVSAELLRITVMTKYFLETNLMLFWTGKSRKGDAILRVQARNLEANEETRAKALFLAEYARQARMALEDERYDEIGIMLDEAWVHKKKLAGISTPEIDEIYKKAREAGAQGGKVCGAGGGGFMIFLADPKCQRDIEEAIGLRRVRFEIDEKGSTVIYNG
jgi:D-glycero-alpha-D-manno-heptose-7-phosphate kinase